MPTDAEAAPPAPATAHDAWVERDAAVVWHGFTQMATFADNRPVIVERAEGRELVDVDGRRYLDAISSLWVTTLGHGVPELDQAVRDQLDRVAHSTLLGNGNRIVVELAEPTRTVIVHPPLDDSGATDAGARLRELGRALGDATRIRVLQELKGGERMLPELCAVLDAPRTTLLHHLALLRGAGLVDLSVTAGEPNVYRLRPEGFEQLARAASAFPLR